MSGFKGMRFAGTYAAKVAAALLVAGALTGCAGNDRVAARPEPQASAPPPPAPSPPPVDLAGRWKLAAAGGGACFMNFGRLARRPARHDCARGRLPGQLLHQPQVDFRA